MKYNYVIVLCASTLNDGKFDEFSKDGSYLGGQVRMQAAADFCKNGNTEKLIVVGGGYGEKNKLKRWKKVDDMKSFLIGEGISGKNIIRVCSNSDTSGNLRAIYITLNDNLKNKTVGLLTNFYHIPRAMRFAQDPEFVWNFKMIPICAESVANSSVPTYLKYSTEFMMRVIGDVVGLRDWENGNYRGQDSRELKGEIHPDDFKKI